MFPLDRVSVSDMKAYQLPAASTLSEGYPFPATVLVRFRPGTVEAVDPVPLHAVAVMLFSRSWNAVGKSVPARSGNTQPIRPPPGTTAAECTAPEGTWFQCEMVGADPVLSVR